MILSDVLQAAVISSVPLLAAFGHLSVAFVYAAGFLSSTLWIFFNTAEFAAVPSLVRKEDLTAANGRLQASYSAASIAGPLLAGLLVATVPVASIFYFDAASFLLSALLVASTRGSFKTTGEDRPDGNLVRGAVEGVRYVLSHPVLRGICIMTALANCVGYTVYAQLVLFAKERLAASDFQVGLLYAAGGAGMVLFALAAAPLRRRLPFAAVTLGAIALGGALILLLSLTRSYPVAAMLWTAIWGLVILFQIATNSLWQETVPAHLLGRVQSTIQALSWSAIPLGTFAGGLAIERTGNVALVYGTIGVVIFFCALAFFFTALGHAERYLPPAQGESHR